MAKPPNADTYISILNLLYDNVSTAVTYEEIDKKVRHSLDPIDHNLALLLHDQLIYGREQDVEKKGNEGNQRATVKLKRYRISHKGYEFVANLRENRSSKRISSWSLGISMVAVLITLWQFLSSSTPVIYVLNPNGTTTQITGPVDSLRKLIPADTLPGAKN